MKAIMMNIKPKWVAKILKCHEICEECDEFQEELERLGNECQNKD